MIEYVDKLVISNGSEYDIYITDEPLMGVYRLVVGGDLRVASSNELPLDMSKFGDYSGDICLLKERDAVEICYVYKKVTAIHENVMFDPVCRYDGELMSGMLVLISHKEDSAKEIINENAAKAEGILKAKADLFRARIEELMETKKPRATS